MQLAGAEPMIDRLQANFECQKLPPSHDSVLPSCQIRNPAIQRWTWSEFTAHIAVKSLHVCHGATLTAETARMTPPTCRCCDACVTDGAWKTTPPAPAAALRIRRVHTG